MTDQLATPDERTVWRKAASGPSHGVHINSRVLLALLDDADERDRLAAAVEREPIEETVCPRCVCPRCFLRRPLSGDDCGCDS